MQQQDTTPTDCGEQRGPDWVLASYGQRVGAWALDFVGFTLPFVLLLIGLFVLLLGFILPSEFAQESIETSSDTLVTEESIEEALLSGVQWIVTAMRLVEVVVGVLVIVVIGPIGWLWGVNALVSGQTPGKQNDGRRVGAGRRWIYMPLLVLFLIGLFVLLLGFTLSSEFVQGSVRTLAYTLIIEEALLSGVEWVVTVMRVVEVVVGVLVIVVIGYIVWWLIALGGGQTPGKQIVGIRVIKDSGEPSNWGYTFYREFMIKLLLVGFFISHITFGIGRLVDYLWPLWDRAEKMQTLHDKILHTIVVQNRN